MSSTETAQESLPRPYDDLAWELELGSTPDGVVVHGTRCRSCGAGMAGRRYACSSCLSSDVEETAFGPQGVLYSYTRIHVGPKGHEPYVLGYVDLDGGVRVLSIVRADGDELACDLPVEVAIADDDWHVRPIAGAEENRANR